MKALYKEKTTSPLFITLDEQRNRWFLIYSNNELLLK